MTIHKLKLNAAYYDDSASGIKTFEIRKVVSKYISHDACMATREGARVAFNLLNDAPTISAVPVVLGEWMPAKDPYDRVYCYRHAGCGCEHNEQSAYCPNCGAKMEDKS